LKPGIGVLLAPGAGADRDQATLVSLDRRLSAKGAEVVRMDFPYRKAGRKAPDKPPVLIQAVRDEASALAARCERVVLGGRSMGCRMCSLAVAEGLGAAGLVLISYPLHPPGKPTSLRTEHFPSLRVPCLFISGTRDAFGSPSEFETAVTAIPGEVTQHWIEGKDHALRGVDDKICELAVEWLDQL
jgi:predicted alpha/beta-hydrolase family hydrolase